MTLWVDVSGYVAAGLVFAAFFMKTAINIRKVAIASNIAFILYGSLSGSTPILVLHAMLLPLNGVRLREMVLLTRNVKKAAASDLKLDWMKPFMSRCRFSAGEVVFRKSDTAREMFVVQSGEFRLHDLGIVFREGDVVGELGILNPSATRMDSLSCTRDGEMLALSYDDWRILFFQNPEFGFYFLRLASARLFSNIDRLEAELAAVRADKVPTPT